MISEPEPYPLIVVLGPTASGKSALALALAERLPGEIVNCDSVQVYRHMDVGTAKVSPAERARVPHHLLDLIKPDQVFTAGDYREAAQEVLAKLRVRRKLPVLVGGTGLYLRALLQGLSQVPRRSEGLRERLRLMAARGGSAQLHRYLTRRDPVAAARIAPGDTQKVIRALEVCLLTGRPLSEALSRGRVPLEGFRPLKVGLDPPRDLLRQRIDRRVVAMYEGGLLEEVRNLLARGYSPQAKSFGALGYRQAVQVLAGRLSREEAVRQTQRATRQYAKQQMTWFRREAGVKWFQGFGDDPDLQAKIGTWLEGALPKPVCGS